MYLFELHYIVIDTGKEILKGIEIDRQLFVTERELFLYAMNMAYDMAKENELFSSIEFIGC